MKVALQVNMTRANAYNVAVDVCNHLAEFGITALVDNELSLVFANIGATFLDADTCIRECDIVISIGGDGTIIHSAHDAVGYDKPVLGINAGRLGFLAGLEKSELDKLNIPRETIFVFRERGTGRPTKKERREIDAVMEDMFLDDDFFDEDEL